MKRCLLPQVMSVISTMIFQNYQLQTPIQARATKRISIQVILISSSTFGNLKTSHVTIAKAVRKRF
ncbi:hypothetical protein T10_1789 [Trichinella papuae]|uniref:Uncharacterized protein n=1 Tax=Trichinella papuae TaxID=268474 RepID=A0A0V1MK01_9BILA|nr:hypothetical protein T10_1789 [Trichinella papuae]